MSPKRSLSLRFRMYFSKHATCAIKLILLEWINLVTFGEEYKLHTNILYFDELWDSEHYILICHHVMKAEKYTPTSVRNQSHSPPMAWSNQHPHSTQSTLQLWTETQDRLIIPYIKYRWHHHRLLSYSVISETRKGVTRKLLLHVVYDTGIRCRRTKLNFKCH
jgi:hypothetical protein